MKRHSAEQIQTAVGIAGGRGTPTIGWLTKRSGSGPVGGQQDFGTPVAGLLGEPVLHRRRSHQAECPLVRDGGLAR